MLDTAVPVQAPRSATGALRITRLRFGTGLRILVIGELDIATVPLLDRELCRAQAETRLVVLDLRWLTFADCAGAHLMLAADHRARWNGGRLVIVRGCPAVERVLALTGFDRKLELVDRPLSQPGAPLGAEGMPR